MDRIDRLKTFLEQSPDDCFLNHALALEYVKLGADIEARIYFEKNRNFDPGYIATYYHLGKLLERTGDEAAAMAVYEEGMLQAKQAGDNHAYSELRSAYEQLAY